MSGRMSLAQGAAISLGAVVGTGVIALPALGAEIAGPASLISWALLIVLSVPLAVTFAALGSRYPDSGGVSTYVRRAFGGRAATVVGWCFYGAIPVGAPAAAMFGGGYVTAAVGGGQTTTLITAAAMVAVVAAVNLGGVQVSGRLQVVLAALLVILLLTATVSALPHAQLANLHPFAPHGWLAIAPAAAVLVWGFAGWEAMTSLAADFRNPKRDIPRATAIALVGVAVLYLGVAAASVLVLGPATGSSRAPLSDLLSIGTGADAHTYTAVAAVIMTLGTMNAYFAAASKLGAALGRDGALPAWFRPGSGVGEIPRRSLALVTVLAAGALALTAVTGVGPRPSVLLTTGSFVLVYVLGTAAAVKLLPRGTWARKASVVALASAIALALMTGLYMLWTLAVSACALLYARRRGLSRTGEPAPAPADDATLMRPMGPIVDHLSAATLTLHGSPHMSPTPDGLPEATAALDGLPDPGPTPHGLPEPRRAADGLPGPRVSPDGRLGARPALDEQPGPRVSPDGRLGARPALGEQPGPRAAPDGRLGARAALDEPPGPRAAAEVVPTAIAHEAAD